MDNITQGFRGLDDVIHMKLGVAESDDMESIVAGRVL